MASQARLGSDLTEGKVSSQLIRFAIPFMLSNGLQTVYSMVDMLVVGRFVGSAGLSAVSISSMLVMLMTTLCMGFATSGQVYIAQLVGLGARDKLNRTIGTLFTTIIAFAVAMTAVGLTLSRPLLQLLNTPAESFPEAMDYMLICSGCIVFTYGYNMVSAVLRGMGDSKNPLLFIAIASAVNVVLDLLFVGVLGWRVAGAAWATIIGQAVSFLVSLVFLYRRRAAFGFDFKLKSYAIDRPTLKTLVKLGIPFAIQMSVINISMLFVNRFINDFGVYASATFGTGGKIQQVPDILTRSIGMATSGMVGQNLGAGKVERAAKTVHVGLYICAAIYAVAAVLFLAFPRQIFSLFTSDVEVIDLAWIYALTAVISYLAHALMSPCNAFVQGLGDAKFSLIVAILDGFVARISFSVLLGIVLKLGLFGFFLGFNLATYVTAIPTAIYFFAGRWKKRALLVEK